MSDSLTAVRAWLDARLCADQQRLLRRQGYVAPERLPSGRTAYKLRYRDAERRQRALYIGLDQQLACQIAGHLLHLQSRRRMQLERRHLMNESLRALRAQRAALAPLLAQHGYAFHGFVIRRTRGASPDIFFQDSGPSGRQPMP